MTTCHKLHASHVPKIGHWHLHGTPWAPDSWFPDLILTPWQGEALRQPVCVLDIEDLGNRDTGMENPAPLIEKWSLSPVSWVVV